MWFPVTDWQFWVSTLIVGGAAWWLIKGFWPKKKNQTKVTLTIKGKKK